MEVSQPLVLHHNLDPKRFVFLWMKYVSGANDRHHCTHSLRGRYSKRLSAHNRELRAGVSVVCDEEPAGSFAALYICGVAKMGYSKKLNYAHNLHLPILHKPGYSQEYSFEDWRVSIDNGIVLAIPAETDMPMKYRTLPPEFTTCRIFRWAVTCFSRDGQERPR